MRNIPRARAAQAALPANRDESSIAVYDGATRIGSIIERGGKHHAFASTGKHLGAFTKRVLAMVAIPSAGVCMRA
jgi:hypothetical protein